VSIIGTKPGRERDANTISKEAALADAEWRKMLADLPANLNSPAPSAG
jgi:hypothetical protein